MNPGLWLDYAGVAVFAATGALAASRKQLDVIGFIFLASVTGIGGGTVRDLILGVPVFWVLDHAYVVVCAIVAIVVFFTAHRLESRYRLLLWLDAIGLSAFAALGADKSLEVTGSPVVAMVMGMLTATFGGILRDMLAGEPSVLLRPEIYVSAALAGAAVFTAVSLAGLPDAAAALLAFMTAFAIRGGALRFGWSFPTYRGRPGRHPDDIP
ncbi:MAG: trimeric intracellular cation channel family protein [Rhizobiaceae bacterium]|nr:trimeric intracellular cation channel family protein [Rhizobiaceae bacterium]